MRLRGRVAVDSRPPCLAEAVCYAQKCVEVVGLLAVARDPIRLDMAASIAAMDEHVALAGPVVECHRAHEASATGGPVAWLTVHVLGVQACRTVVAVASVGQRQHGGTAVLAGEALILGGSGDGRASGLKGSSTRGAGFRVLFPKDPGLAGRGTDSPPFLLGRRLLPVPTSSGLVASPNPDHDRGCGFVSATVKQATPLPTGRCHSSRTGVGVVPCQPVTVAGQRLASTLTSSAGSPAGIESPPARPGNRFPTGRAKSRPPRPGAKIPTTLLWLSRSSVADDPGMSRYSQGARAS